MGLVDVSYQPWNGDLQGRGRRVAALVSSGLRLAFDGAMTKLMLACTYAIVVVFIGILYIVSASRIPWPIALGNNLYREYLNSPPYGLLIMMLTAIVGARLISRDLKTNAVAMYFSKAITRSDYVAGKFAVIAIFLLSATFLPSFLLWTGQLAMGQEELTWGERLADLWALTAHSLVIVLPSSAVILALSSLSRTAYVPGILWVLAWIGSDLVSAILTAQVREEWCKLVSWRNLGAHLGNAFYPARELKMKTPFGEAPFKFPPVSELGWQVPAVVLGAVVVLSLAVVLWRLRRIEDRE